MPSHYSRIPKLNASWCGCSLETAAKIVGYIDLILNSALFLISVVETVFLLTGWAVNDFLIYFIEAAPVMFFITLQFFFKGLMATYLLIGVYKNRPHYIKTWVVVEGAYIIITTISTLVYLIILMFGFLHPNLIIEAMSLGVQMYFFLLVYSYYRDLRPEIGLQEI